MADSATLDGSAIAAAPVVPQDLAAFAPHVDRLVDGLDALDLERACSFTLGDAIRLGATGSVQAYGWGDADTACALSAGIAGALTRGYL